MSANMDKKKNGKAAFGYVIGDEKPWWDGMGGLHADALPADATIEQWIQAAGMDFEVKEAPVQFTTEDGRVLTFDKFKALYRGDDFRGLNVTGSGFKTVQPRPIFTEFFEPAIRQAGFAMNTAGVIGDGGKYWALAKTGKGFTLPGGDEFEGYLLLATSCDYSMPTIARLTTRRPVCENTLDAAIADIRKKGNKRGTDAHAARIDREGRPYLRVTHRSEFNFKKALEALSIIDVDKSLAILADTLKAFQGVKINDEQARSYFNAVLGLDATGKKRQKMGATSFADLLNAPATISQTGAEIEKDPRSLTKLFASYQDAPGATPGTLYGAVNGVTHYVDHVKGWNRTRFESAGFGDGQNMKVRAMQMAATFMADRAATATTAKRAAKSK